MAINKKWISYLNKKNEIEYNTYLITFFFLDISRLAIFFLHAIRITDILISETYQL